VHGELIRLGHHIAASTVWANTARCRHRPRTPTIRTNLAPV
jgi:hypothetical protein